MIARAWLKGVDCISCKSCDRSVSLKEVSAEDRRRLVVTIEALLGKMDAPKVREEVDFYLCCRFRCSACGGRGEAILFSLPRTSLIKDDLSDLKLDEGYDSGTRAYDPDSGECNVGVWEGE
jgi:hypothetical protein